MENPAKPKIDRPSSPIPDTPESVIRALMTTPPPSSGPTNASPQQ